jgi:hypothetical protein
MYNQQFETPKPYQLPTITTNHRHSIERMMDDDEGIIPQAWKTNIGKIVLISGGVVALLLASGALFRVLAYTVGGWKELKKASRG